MAAVEKPFPWLTTKPRPFGLPDCRSGTVPPSAAPAVALSFGGGFTGLSPNEQPSAQVGGVSYGQPVCESMRCRMGRLLSHGGSSKTKFAVGTEAHEIEMSGIGLAVDQDQVGFDVAVPMVLPLTGKRVVAVAWS